MPNTMEMSQINVINEQQNDSKTLFQRLSHCQDLNGVIEISELKNYVYDASRSAEVWILYFFLNNTPRYDNNLCFSWKKNMGKLQRN